MTRIIAICAGLSLLSVCACGSAKQASFVWGVNGHPYVQEGYKEIPVATQLDLVKELGAGWYRTDWPESVFTASPSGIDRLVAGARARGLRMLPIVMPSVSCRTDASPDEIRKASFEYARMLASRYRGKVTHWELDNELDIWCMIHKGEKLRSGEVWQYSDPNGDLPDHYEESRYQKAKAELLGLSEGVKAGDPKAKTIIDSGGWLHYGWFERLVREDRVPFDILGWHWYSEMGDMTSVMGKFDVMRQLRSYGKPIWITEIDRRGGSLGSEKEQAGYIAKVSAQVSGMPGVEAMFVYELLDEPYFGADNPESHYGLATITRGPDGKWQVDERKEAFTAYRTSLRKDR